MDKKNLMIIGGVIALAAIAYFVTKKKKDDKIEVKATLTESKETEED